jgi:predicted oxidoreductase (fatty acid repression mutant protein)
MASKIPFLEAIASRRSVYALSKNTPISNDRILELITSALEHAPSPFNVRSTRILVLFADEHTRLWDEAYKITEEATPASIAILGPKIKAFSAAKGTVRHCIRLPIQHYPLIVFDR